MKIYTKKGDRGETGLFGGKRVAKDHPRIRAYGAVDETNAVIGWARSLTEEGEVDRALEKIQNNLMDVGTFDSTPNLAKDTEGLEREIDRMEADLPPLKNFILPGGTPLAAALQMARTAARRAEREVAAAAKEADLPPEILVYLNRLSDYLFVLARWVNRRGGGRENIWRKK